MKNIWFSGFLLIAGTTVFAASVSNQQASVKAFALKAKQYVQTYGKYRAILAFNNPNGQFRPGGDRYIFAFVCGSKQNDGFNLADSPTVERQTVFESVINSQPFIQRIINSATTQGHWITYEWNDPLDNKSHVKHSYVIKLPKYRLCIGSGYYGGVTQ